MDTVLVKTYSPPPLDENEILRYAGAKKFTPEIDSLLKECLAETESVFSYRVCFREFSLLDDGEFLNLSFTKTTSKDLRKNLANCERVIVFAATVGIALDRLINRYSKIAPARALMLGAIGAERIESLVNTFNWEISQEKKAQGLFTVPRFSPGYGDFPLSAQKDIFSVLDCPRKIGLSLNNSLLMSPSKSVTALIGVTPCNKKNINSVTCLSCQKADCAFRRTQ